jgi:hypothetical protein
MLYMVIEKYRHGPGPVYQRATERGRLLPDGLRYVDSWVVDDDRPDRCFQLMETDDPGLLDVWQSRWADLTERQGDGGDVGLARAGAPRRRAVHGHDQLPGRRPAAVDQGAGQFRPRLQPRLTER